MQATVILVATEEIFSVLFALYGVFSLAMIGPNSGTSVPSNLSSSSRRLEVVGDGGES